MDKIVAGLLVLVGIIHPLPVSGVLGLFIVYAAFKHLLQPLAFFAGFLSVVSFMAIAWSVGGYNDAIRKVVIADVVAVIALCVAASIYVYSRNQN